MISKANKTRLKALSSQDAAWTDIAKYEQKLEGILDRGFHDHTDVIAVRSCIAVVLGEIAWRKAEMISELNSSDQ